MDHGADHPTYVCYVYVAKRPIVKAKIVEGDYIQIAEYFRSRAHVIDHLPRLQELQRRFQPKGYFCDSSMWDQDKSCAASATPCSTRGRRCCVTS